MRSQNDGSGGLRNTFLSTTLGTHTSSNLGSRSAGLKCLELLWVHVSEIGKLHKTNAQNQSTWTAPETETGAAVVRCLRTRQAQARVLTAPTGNTR